MTPSHIQSNMTDYAISVSIGAWHLLVDCRRMFCRSIAEHAHLLGNLDELQIGSLLTYSYDRWNAIYKNGDFSEAQGKQQADSLLRHLEKMGDRIPDGTETKRWAKFLEHIIIPYVISAISTETTSKTTKVRPWFPDNAFLNVYYKEHDYKDYEEDEPPLHLFLQKEVFALLRGDFQFGTKFNISGVYQDALPFPDSVNQARLRFASGMRALQSKIIGSFDNILVEESASVDQLVGNGSAFMCAIHDESGLPLGLICFSSPIIGLYHELLLPKSIKCLPSEERFLQSVFLCPATLSEQDRRWVDALVSDEPCSDTAASNTLQPLHTTIANGDHSMIDLLICRSCERGNSETRCVFADMDGWLRPTLGTFLGGLKQIADRAELEQLKKYAAYLSHNFSSPLAAAARTFISCSNHLSALAPVYKPKLSKIETTLLALYKISESTLRHFNPDRVADPIGDSEQLQPEDLGTDLYDMVNELPELPFFEKLFQLSVTYDLVVIGTPTQIVGHKGDWYVILLTLLTNAFRYADETRANFSQESLPKVKLTLLYLEDGLGNCNIEIRNTSVVLEPMLLVAMNQCIKGELPGIPSGIHIHKNESFGVGLGLVGKVVSHYKFDASVEQEKENLEVVVRISNVPFKN